MRLAYSEMPETYLPVGTVATVRDIVSYGMSRAQNSNKKHPKKSSNKKQQEYRFSQYIKGTQILKCFLLEFFWAEWAILGVNGVVQRAGNTR